jgi:peptide chain release factor 1
MTPDEISKHIEHLKNRFEELELRMQDPALFSKQKEYRSVSREHQQLTGLFENYSRWVKALEELEENRALMSSEEDEELKEMVQLDIDSLDDEVSVLESKVMLLLLPPDPNDGRNIIVQVKPAAGGDEASLFAGEMLRAYTRFAENLGWKTSTLEYTGSDLGGIKDAVLSFQGDDVYSHMKFESGVHRVQRIPTTESGGRIHTSTITVSVLPEADQVDEIAIPDSDLRIDVYRASGPGGQCVNTTDSAVRITHVPTGIVVTSQQEKSQHKNKAQAMRILSAKLLELRQKEEAAKHASAKRDQVGTGDRSERIRTYNFPQNRVTDHRYGITSYDLPKFMEGDMLPGITQIMTTDCERRLADLTK